MSHEKHHGKFISKIYYEKSHKKNTKNIYYEKYYIREMYHENCIKTENVSLKKSWNFPWYEKYARKLSRKFTP